MNHLKAANTSYFKHFYYATYFNLLGLMMVITGIVHSIIPSLFEFTPYKIAKKIVTETEKHFINDK